jgi:diaminohydroxyphosphoribosylaminopyrimidine deaminase/5-amino-6-(5-phosphoribosylamino)uracil reductase
MWTSADEQWLRRAMRLAVGGRGRVEPNPLVGCVIARDGRVIGEGYHQRFGAPHAEPNALNACHENPAGSTMYVTLEPCSHTNKKTPPCVPTLIAAQPARIVIGTIDPNREVNGRGVVQLQNAGIEVQLAPPDLAAECRQLIAPFILRQEHHRPYVTLKWAESADGKVAGHEGMRRQITGPAATQQVHELRARCDAVLVGMGTVLADDPMLTARDVAEKRPIERIVIDRRLRLPLDSKLARTANDVPTVVITSLHASAEEFEELMALGVRVAWPAEKDEDFLAAALDAGSTLDRAYTHVLVEPGPTLANVFFESDYCDRVWRFVAPMRIDDATAPSAAEVPDHFVETGRVTLGDDTLIEYLNPQSPAFHAAVPSADLILAGLARG